MHDDDDDDDEHDDDDNGSFLCYGWLAKDVWPFFQPGPSPPRISDTPQAGFEPAQNLSSGLVEWSYEIATTLKIIGLGGKLLS